MTAGTTDLFGWLNALWAKNRPDGTPPIFMMHRFLASERDFAPFARELQQRIKDPALIFGIWQAVLPKDSTAPRLSYVVPKKPPAEEALVERMKNVLSESRSTCERMLAIIQLAGREQELYVEFGIKESK